MLLSLPAILGANALEFARADARVAIDVAVLAVGFAAAFVIGAAALRVLQWAVSERRLYAFAAYCLVAGVGALFLC